MADDSRIELQLRALNGEDVVVPYPQSRVEKLLYKMNGYDIELDPPQSRYGCYPSSTQKVAQGIH